MIEKLLALAPKTANCKLHFFVPFNFMAYSSLPVLQILIKFSNTSSMNYLCLLLFLFGIFASNPLKRSSLRFGGLEAKSARK